MAGNVSGDFAPIMPDVITAIISANGKRTVSSI
jgi:hypothetical protein